MRRERRRGYDTLNVNRDLIGSPLLLSFAARASAAVLLSVLLLGTPARALTLTVPDDVPTIQAALDAFVLANSPAPDTLRLRGGNFAETPTMRTSIVVEWARREPADPRPRVAGLNVFLEDAVLADIHGVEIAGPLSMGVSQPATIRFEDCRFEAAILQLSSDGLLGGLSFRRCTFRASAQLHPGGDCVIDSCHVEGQIRARWSDASVIVTNSTFQGPGAGAAIAADGVNRLTVSNTTIRGYSVAILADTEDFAVAHDNTIEDCRFGISVGHADRTRIERNTIRNCGDGIRAWGRDIVVTDNQIENCSGTGLAVFDGLVEISGNVITRCGGDGMLLGWGSEDAAGSVHNNTLCSNGGSGVALEVDPEPWESLELVRNVAFGNGGYGVHWRIGSVGVSSCNDWFGNKLGAVGGETLAAGDFELDPLFCDPASGDFHPSSVSPLVNRSGCDLIGALGVGCEPKLEIAFQFTPMTLNAASNGRWVTAELDAPAPYSADAIDVASIRLNGVPVDPAAPTGPGAHGRSSHRALTVRFDRVAVARTLSYGDSVSVVVTGEIGDRTFHGRDFIRVQRGTGSVAVDITHESAAGENPPALSIRAWSLRSAAGGPLTVEFVLPSRSSARLDLLDVAGRVMTTRQVGELGAGRHTLELAPERALPQGIYFLRLRQGADEARSRAAVIQ